MTRETKRVGGHVTETKIKKVRGVEVGEISGYIAAWTVDEGLIPDKFIRGAFLRSIQEHKNRPNADGTDRQVRFKDHHGRTVGGFPISGVYEDNVGLYGTAQVNLEVQQGREAFALARQGVLVDFSVGFTAKQRQMINGVRNISDADLNEGSIVDEPMNRQAQIFEVKSMNKDLPIAAGTVVWNPSDAERRVCDTSFGEMKGVTPYIGDYLILDVVDGTLSLVPEAVQFAAEELKSNTAADPDHIRQVERLLSRMSLPSPFEEAKRQFFGVDDVKDWTLRDVEQAMVKSGAFSNGAAKMLVKQIASGTESIVTPDRTVVAGESKGFSDLLKDLQDSANELRG